MPKETGGGFVCDCAAVPHNQMVAGIYDIFNSVCERYFSGDDDNTGDSICEALTREEIVQVLRESRS